MYSSLLNCFLYSCISQTHFLSLQTYLFWRMHFSLGMRYKTLKTIRNKNARAFWQSINRKKLSWYDAMSTFPHLICFSYLCVCLRVLQGLFHFQEAQPILFRYSFISSQLCDSFFLMILVITIFIQPWDGWKSVNRNK